MARPQVYTNEQIVAALKETKGLVYLAAKRVGCDPDTIYIRAKRVKAVASALKNERGEIVDTAELALYQAILAGKPWAIAMTLKTLGKDRGYVERQEIQNVGDDELDAEIERELAKMGADRQAPSAPQDSLSESVEPSARPASNSLP